MNKKNIRWLLIGLIALVVIVLGFYYDSAISVFFQNFQRIFLSEFLFVLGFLSNVIILFFFLTSLFLWQEHKRRWILPLWLSLFFSVVVSFFFKILIARPRPFLVLGEGFRVLAVALKESYLTWNTSFPSFHAVLVFSALPVLDKEFPRLKWWWLVFASLVALSRVYFGVHYLSDVLIGALLGYGIGMLMVKSEEIYGFGRRIVKWLGLGR